MCVCVCVCVCQVEVSSILSIFLGLCVFFQVFCSFFWSVLCIYLREWLFICVCARVCLFLCVCGLEQPVHTHTHTHTHTPCRASFKVCISICECAL